MRGEVALDVATCARAATHTHTRMKDVGWWKIGSTTDVREIQIRKLGGGL